VSRFRFIAAEKATSSVVRLCRVLEVSSSGFYAWQHRQPSQRQRADNQLTDGIRTVHANSHRTYGAPRVHAELRATGTRVGKKRVAPDASRGTGWQLSEALPSHDHPFGDTAAQPSDLVRRDFKPSEPDRLWIPDITYIRTREGWLYLAVILDAFSCRVVGWALADHPRTELATDALHMALTSHQPAAGLVHHSGRGGQYLSAAYIAIRLRRSLERRPGYLLDNAAAESFFATLQTELLHRAVWPTRQHAKTAIFDYVEGFYNRLRRHSTLDYRSPADLEADDRSATLAA
jgi:putative transposase